MPNALRHQTIWLPTGNPDTTNITSDDFNALGGQPGSLGQEFEYVDRTYQRVQLDSGATAAGSVAGAVAANQLAYWKNKDVYLVTNDRRFALGFSGGNDGYRNQIAGIFRSAVTAGRYCDVLKRGDNIAVKSDGLGADGDVAVGAASANAEVTRVTAGTAPTCIPVGVIRGAAAGGNINVDVDIPDTP
jgi:hypothetical protein